MRACSAGLELDGQLQIVLRPDGGRGDNGQSGTRANAHLKSADCGGKRNNKGGGNENVQERRGAAEAVNRRRAPVAELGQVLGVATRQRQRVEFFKERFSFCVLQFNDLKRGMLFLF